MELLLVKKLTDKEIQDFKILSWPVWEKEVSRFNWFYDETEECYFLEGRVVLETEDGKKTVFGKGDFVTFSKGLACVWDITEPVRKHYNFPV